MKKTTVINLLAGPGAGKSTLAAALFAAMKDRGLSVELVREYVKHWAWDGKKVGPFDQLYIFGKQVHAESRLYGKVDYIVTDSPYLLSAVYERHYRGRDIVLPSMFAFMNQALNEGVTYKNFFLSRIKPYVNDGRFETEEQARGLDRVIRSFLHDYNIDRTVIGQPTTGERVEAILEALELNEVVSHQ